MGSGWGGGGGGEGEERCDGMAEKRRDVYHEAAEGRRMSEKSAPCSVLANWSDLHSFPTDTSSLLPSSSSLSTWLWHIFAYMDANTAKWCVTHAQTHRHGTHTHTCTQSFSTNSWNGSLRAACCSVVSEWRTRAVLYLLWTHTACVLCYCLQGIFA